MIFCWKLSTEEVLLIVRPEEKAFARSLLTARVLLLLVVVVLRFFALLSLPLSPSTEESSDETDESSSSTSLLMSSKCKRLPHSHDIPSLEVVEERILAVPRRAVVPSASMVRPALGAEAAEAAGAPSLAVLLAAVAFCWSWLKEVMVGRWH